MVTMSNLLPVSRFILLYLVAIYGNLEVMVRSPLRKKTYINHNNLIIDHMQQNISIMVLR